MLKTKLRKITHNPVHYLRYIASHIHFRHLQTICLPMGFPNCANQALAWALTAHPNIVMSNHLDALENWWHNLSMYSTNLAWKMFLTQIRKADRDLSLNKAVYVDKSLIFYSIPEQWQGRSKRITVIGDCSPTINTKVLMKKSYKGKMGECMGLVALKEQTAAMKIIFFVRNPYDIIGSGTMRSNWEKEPKEIIDILINRFIVNCERSETLFNRIAKEDIFIWRFEECITDFHKTMSELCGFLGVETTESYIEACSEIFTENLNKNRHKIEWHEDARQRIAAAIEQYDFLSGYSWDS